MHLDRFPRVFRAGLLTPPAKMDCLFKDLGGPEIWNKRDDCAGLSTSGNKPRKLAFFAAQSLAMAGDTVMTQGATQPSHARQTAVFAAKPGLGRHSLLEDRTGLHDGI